MENLFLGAPGYFSFNRTGKKSYKMHPLLLYFLKQRTVYTSDGSGPTLYCGVLHQIFTEAQVGDRHGARWWDLQAHS